MQSTGIGSWEYRKGFLGSGMSTIPFQAVYEIPLEHAKEQMQILRRTTSTLPMNTGHFTAPLQGARLILGLYPGLRFACPGLLSFGPSGAFFYRAECSFQA